jgi:hypothetical protein
MTTSKRQNFPDFPDVDRWSKAVAALYEHRLRADYDNWSNTASENALSSDCIFAGPNFCGGVPEISL